MAIWGVGALIRQIQIRVWRKRSLPAIVGVVPMKTGRLPKLGSGEATIKTSDDCLRPSLYRLMRVLKGEAVDYRCLLCDRPLDERYAESDPLPASVEHCSPWDTDATNNFELAPVALASGDEFRRLRQEHRRFLKLGALSKIKTENRNLDDYSS